MQLFTLRRLLIDELQEMYVTEQIVREALPRMERGAADKDLRAVFADEAKTAQGRLDRMERVFEIIKDSPRGGHGKTMKVLVSEYEDRMGDGGDPAVVDGSLIAAARRIQHWEIASYAAAYAFAVRLDLKDVADLLKASFEESQASDTRLGELAMRIPVKGNDEA